MVSCRNKNVYDLARELRWFGISRERHLPDETGERQYDAKMFGYKYHMNNMSAALGIGNMDGILERLERRREIARIYNEEFSRPSNEDSAYWLYDMIVGNRSDFMKMMKSKDIPVSVVHRGINRNTVFSSTADLPMQRHWDEHLSASLFIPV